MAKFNEFWDGKISAFQEQEKQVIEGLNERHKEAQGKEQEKIKEGLPKTDRTTPEVLNVKFQIAKLAKDQRYNEAHNLKRKLEKLVRARSNVRKTRRS